MSKQKTPVMLVPADELQSIVESSIAEMTTMADAKRVMKENKVVNKKMAVVRILGELELKEEVTHVWK